MKLHKLLMLGSRATKAIGIAGLLASGSYCLAQSTSTITISLNGMDYLAEDDPMSSDEPYLITIGFRFQLTKDQGLLPHTLDVRPVGGGPQNNLGRSGDNWASKGRSYSWGGMDWVATVPARRPGWVVGVMAIFMEEDGFSNSTAATMRNSVRDQVEQALRALSFKGYDPNAVGDALVKKVMSDVHRSLRRFDMGGLIRSVASAVDPDDYGGINMVMAITTHTGVNIFAGEPPADLANMQLTPLMTPPVLPGRQTATAVHNFSLMYPIGDLSAIPNNARYTGRARINGSVRLR
jgi:hypothetical protein